MEVDPAEVDPAEVDPADPDKTGSVPVAADPPRILPHHPQAHLETIGDRKRDLTSKEFQDYCRKVFKFTDVEVHKLKSWKDRRTYHRQEQKKRLQQVGLYMLNVVFLIRNIVFLLRDIVFLLRDIVFLLQSIVFLLRHICLSST